MHDKMPIPENLIIISAYAGEAAAEAAKAELDRVGVYALLVRNDDAFTTTYGILPGSIHLTVSPQDASIARDLLASETVQKRVNGAATHEYRGAIALKLAGVAGIDSIIMGILNTLLPHLQYSPHTMDNILMAASLLPVIVFIVCNMGAFFYGAASLRSSAGKISLAASIVLSVLYLMVMFSSGLMADG